jgi:NAD(P)-dependent dehydrogenase (short-subunit alcohol dehydrogenase family)
MQLQGTAAIVTGGTGSIGRAIVSALESEGARVSVWDVLGSGASVTCDVTEVASVAGALAATTESIGAPTGLVTAAGVSLGMAPTASTATAAEWDSVLSAPEAWETALRVNLIGTANCIRAFTRQLAERSLAGAVVTISSINGGPVAEPGFAAYSCSKAGVNMLTRIAAAELGSLGISVNSIAPGVMAHAMSPVTSPRSSGVRDNRLVDRVQSSTPLGARLGAGDDVAEAVIAVLGVDWMTGQIIAVDGGLTLKSPIDAAGSRTAANR